MANVLTKTVVMIAHAITISSFSLFAAMALAELFYPLARI